jgi:hypothetical protein
MHECKNAELMSAKRKTGRSAFPHFYIFCISAFSAFLHFCISAFLHFCIDHDTLFCIQPACQAARTSPSARRDAMAART